MGGGMKRVLVVDDGVFTLKVTVFRLSQAGFEALTAESGAQALELSRNLKPDLILLDLGLPDMDGESVCRALKADERTRPIPVILFTASSGNIEQRTTACGAQGFLIKPYELGDLLALVRATAL